MKPKPRLSTFSIVGHDPNAQEWGIGVQSKFLAVGAVVPWARAGVGAVATQSYANTAFGPDGLALMARGLTAEEALGQLVAGDEGCERRQVGLVDATGLAATFTGDAGWPFDFPSTCTYSQRCFGLIMVTMGWAGPNAAISRMDA